MQGRVTRPVPYTTKAQLVRRLWTMGFVLAISTGFNLGVLIDIFSRPLAAARAELKIWLIGVL